MQTTWKVISQFPATAKDGTVYIIYMQEGTLHDARGIDAEPSTHRGLVQFVTGTGEWVKRIGKGKYELSHVIPPVELVSDHPDCY